MPPTQILVVEDERITAENIRQNLISLGYSVPDVVAYGEEVVEKAAALRPDLVLMDIGLAGDMDGIAAAAQIQNCFDIPVVYLTAYSAEEILQRAKVTEPFGYLLKPFQIRELRSTVEMALYKHQMQQKLRENQAELIAIFDNVPLMMILLDRERRVRRVNHAVVQFTGQAAEEMMERRVGEALRCLHALDVPAGCGFGPACKTCAVRQTVVDTFKTGDGHYQVEASLPLVLGPSPIPGGEEKPAHSHFLVSTTLLNLSDEPMVLVSINDITERKQAEQGLHDSVQKLRIAYQQAQIYAQELTQEITERQRAEKELKRRNEELNALNAIAAAIGQSLELKQILPVVLEQTLTLLGLDEGWIQLLDPQRGELALVTQRGISSKMAQKMAATKANQDLSSQVVQTGEPVIITDAATDSQFAAELPPGESLHAMLSAPVKAQDKVWGVLTVFSRDSRGLAAPDAQLLAAIGQQLGMAVEKLHLAEITSKMEVLQELERFQSELVANVSHELRTPLGLIKIFCTTLLREDVTFDQATHLEFLHDIDAETSRLEKIVDNLLNMSRLQEKRLQLDKRPTDLKQLVAETVKAIAAQSARHHFMQDFPAEPLLAVFDPKYIEQVLRNLLNNAIKYSPEGGPITIRGYADQGQLYLHVSDPGIGIPTTELERVFERFYRVKNEQTQSAPGVGLGLAVCRGIVEAHGGRIWVESAEQAGSTFSFCLPLAGEKTENLNESGDRL